MQEIFPDIFEVLPSKQTPSKYRSFFVKRTTGNLLIPCFSNSSTIEAHFDALAQLGGIHRQLLGDSHFKSAHCDAVAERFGSPLYCSEVEAPDVTPTVKHVVTFPFIRHFIETGVEVIPTPGHRTGGVCYLVTVADTRYLFVGDFLWHDGNEWITTARTATQKAYIHSLHLLDTLEFDVLLANSQLNNPIYSVEVTAESRKAFIAERLKQMNAS